MRRDTSRRQEDARFSSLCDFSNRPTRRPASEAVSCVDELDWLDAGASGVAKTTGSAHLNENLQ